MSENDSYIVAGSRPWNRRILDETIRNLPGRCRFVGSRDELSLDFVKETAPRYIFFVHWSWKVPPEIVDAYECVAFHMTDLPYGRGGSPLQNLIVRGHDSTRLSAFRMTGDFDAGPIYGKRDLSLEGTAQEIYERATELSARMIEWIVREEPEPSPQNGEVVVFKRRRPEQSEIRDGLESPESLYDFIRMLDCEGYPAAFLEHHGFRYEFRGAQLSEGGVSATVTITPREEADR
ncbi:MAG: methionyl-tRNA formyltransferase [Acidobacteriota bacterium]|nr:methionyl-tRNA formyltransferase [Acidobacteriota bacterium]